MIREDREQTNRLLELNEEAQEALRKVCEIQGVKYDELQAVMSNLYSVCVYGIEQIQMAFENLRSAICKTITPAISALSESLSETFGFKDLFWMVPPHIKHLAYNHPKSRVRNKNWNRMWKIRERYMKCHKQ